MMFLLLQQDILYHIIILYWILDYFRQKLYSVAAFVLLFYIKIHQRLLQVF
jgi:hypothetical protein